MSVKHIILEFMDKFKKSDVMSIAAQTAFYILLSIPPLLIVIISIGVSKVSLDLLADVLPFNVYSIVESIITVLPSSSSITVVSAIGALFAASGSVWALMKGIHKAHTNERMSFSLMNRIYALLFTIAFIAGIGATLCSVIFRGLMSNLFEVIDQVSFLDSAIFKKLVSMCIVYIFIHLLYQFTPGVGLKGKGLFWGALFSAVGWTIAESLFQIYITKFTKFTLYGSIGTFFILMMWLYVISIVILTGAQINALFAEKKIISVDII